MILLTEDERQQLVNAHSSKKWGAVDDVIDSLMCIHPDAFTADALQYRHKKLQDAVKYSYRKAAITSSS